MLACVVIRCVILYILHKPSFGLRAKFRERADVRIKVNEKWLDFGAEEVIRTRGAELGQARSIVARDKPQHRIIMLHGRNHAATRRDLPSQKGEELHEERASFVL